MALSKQVLKTGLALSALGLVATGCGNSVTAAQAAGSTTEAGVVRTGKGQVRGMVAADHRLFQGIPYAAPPVGALRWRPPQPARPWSRVRDATKPGSPCAQEGIELGAPSTSEDCLYLNVTTPAKATGKRLPVMVYLHGGSFEDGTGQFYGARKLAAQGGVVVVTVNYRLGALGFLAHPALGGGGNYGMQDQQAALRWVRGNAAAFGGDARNVTLIGESAGANATCSHLAAPASRGLFHRAVIQSGPCGRTWSPLNANQPRPLAAAERQGRDLASRVPGLGASPTARQLREVPVGRLLEAAKDHPGFGPVTGDGVLPEDPARALRSGRIAKVPVLHGTTHDEHRMHIWGMEMGLYQGKPLPEAEYPKQVKAMFGDKAGKVLARYPRADFGSASVALATVLTDHLWANPAVRTDELLSQTVPTYAYEFAEKKVPWFAGLDATKYPMGAFHTGELSYLFEIKAFEQLTKPQDGLSRQMIGYWTRFARTGDPNGGGAPAWRRFDGARQHIQSLSSDGIRPADFKRDHRYAFWAALGR